MAEYIEKELALKKLCEGCCEYDSENTECSCNEQLAILGIPAADVAPVVHGRWIDMRESSKDVPQCRCSVCGEFVLGLERNYCPNCGARMDEKGE